jgi:peptidyl-prolyl cis-trans isomerase A (cyclophilin A)
MANVAVNVLKDNKKLWIALIALLIVIFYGMGNPNGLGGAGSFFKLKSTSTKTTTGSSSSYEKSNLAKVDKYKKVPEIALIDQVDYRAKFVTNYGSFTIDLFETDTPETVNSFIFLAKEKYFNNLNFFYVKKGVLIQSGDPANNGTGGPGYIIEDEIDARALGLDKIKVKDASNLRYLYSPSDDLTKPFDADNLAKYPELSLMDFYKKSFGFTYTSGYGTTKFAPSVVAMANSGADSAGSQFFITSKDFDKEFYDGRFTVFGKVIEGQATLDKIESVSVSKTYKPVKDVMINSVTILEK